MTHKFKNDKGEWEEIEHEIFEWTAQYDDGTVLKQFDDEIPGKDAFFHRHTEIDQSKLSLFRMQSRNGQVYSMGFDPSRMKLIHFYHRYGDLNKSPKPIHTVYGFGYEVHKDKHGNPISTERVIFMIMPDGEVIITDDARKVKLIF